MQIVPPVTKQGVIWLQGLYLATIFDGRRLKRPPMCRVEEKASQEAAKAQCRATKAAKKGAGQKNTILDHFAAAKTVRPALRPSVMLSPHSTTRLLRHAGLMRLVQLGYSRMHRPLQPPACNRLAERIRSIMCRSCA